MHDTDIVGSEKYDPTGSIPEKSVGSRFGKKCSIQDFFSGGLGLLQKILKITRVCIRCLLSSAVLLSKVSQSYLYRIRR